MATERRGRNTSGNGDQMQNVEVQRVPGQGSSDGENENPVRVFYTKAFLAHYRHIRGGKRTDTKGCGMCQKGLDAVLVPATEESTVPRASVVPSARIDEEKADTPAPDSRRPWWYRNE